MRCKLCRQEAVYTPLRFCKEHFITYYEKKVRKYLESTGTRHTRILIGVSGGKDSSALVHALVQLKEEFDLELGLLLIDLRIPEYSEKGKVVVEKLARKYELPLLIEDLNEYEKQIQSFATKDAKPCGPCGTIKRYLLNKAAVEHEYEYVATGHNLDDEFWFCMHNLLQRNVDQLRRQEKRLPPRKEFKLAGRVKPLYYLTEKENRLYCLLSGVPHDADECPYAGNNPQLRFKVEHRFTRDEKKNVLKSVQKLQEERDEGAKEVIVGDAPGELHACPSCAFPTTSKDSCVYCKLMSGERQAKRRRRRR